MPTEHDEIRERLLARANLLPPPKTISLSELTDEIKCGVWCEDFLDKMFNRLLMGRLRYGPRKAKSRYDFLQAIEDKLNLYRQTGNDELLVDIGNYAMLEYNHGDHPLKHFSAYDDAGGHAKLK
jgi:hypothetical protein